MPRTKITRQRRALQLFLLAGTLAAAAAWLALQPKEIHSEGLGLGDPHADRGLPLASTEGLAAAPAQLEPERTQLGASPESSASDGSTGRAHEVVIRVQTYDGHGPVPEAAVWTVPSHPTRLVTGPDGSVRFWTTDEALLAGVESAPGCLLWDPRSEPDGVTERGSSVLTEEVAVAADGVTEIDLIVRRGATIRGTLVDADGVPLPKRTFYLAAADGMEWLPGKGHRTDENGCFQLQGLRPNWYLIGPDPVEFDVFPYEHIRADWASSHEVVLQHRPALTVSMDVAPEGLGSEDPWPFPLTYRLVRDDRMVVIVNRRRQSRPDWMARKDLCSESTRGPVRFECDLFEGPYLLEILAKGRLQVDGKVARWMGVPWRRKIPFVVTASGDVEFGAPEPSGRITIEGMDRVAFIRAAVVGSGDHLHMQFGVDADTTEYTFRHHYALDAGPPGADPLLLAFDHDQLPSKTVEFSQLLPGKGNHPLASVDLTVGLEEVTLQCKTER